MSAKKGEYNLLMPGADGWEIWGGSSDSGFQLVNATEHLQALEVTGYRSGSVMMAIPVRQVSAVPFRAQTNDLSLLGDLALMQLEKNGSRPALDGGQLTDHFVYEIDEEETDLTAVVMAPPGEGQLPTKSPEAFDLSARCLPLPENKVAIWKELGRWVFAIGKPGHALYFQCLSGDQLDARAGNEIRLALTQLQIQGMLPVLPDAAVVWSHGSASDARPEEIEVLSRGLGIPVENSPRPAPGWPNPPSRLLPADVRAERLAGKAKQNRQIAIAVALVLYVGLAAFLFFKLRKAEAEARLVERDAKVVVEDAQAIADHEAKWSELEPVVETRFHPLEVLLACYEALPNDDQRFIRLKQAVFLNQFKEIDGDLKVARTIYIEGLCEEVSQPKIAEFNGALRKSEDLLDFKDNWNFGAETKDKKSGKLTFKFEGNATQ